MKNIGAVINRVLRQNSSKILRGLGLAGLLLVPIQAVRITPTAMRLLEEKKEQEDREELTVMETVRTAGKCYIPSVVLCGISLGLLGWSGTIDGRRNAAIVTAYSLSESALQEYQDKIVETFGEKKEQAVRDSIAKDKVDRNPVANNEVYLTHRGETLCYDVYSGRYFKTDIDKLRKAENEINRRMLSEGYISLNDFYEEIGLPCIKAGDDTGWNTDKGFLELKFSSQLADDNTPCLVISYKVSPEYTHF